MADQPATLAEVQADNIALAEELAIVRESMADLDALAREDKGWLPLGADDVEFSPQARRSIVAQCRDAVVSNPLIKQGINARIGYIWGQGVGVRATTDGEDGDQTTAVNGVAQAMLEANTKSLFGAQAQEELERALGTDGEVFLTCFTDPVTGAVRVRSTPAGEIVNVVTNPEDRDEPWFYVRHYTVRKVEAGYRPGSTRTRGEVRKVAYPALGHRPNVRPKMLDGAEVRWDAPMLHVPVNRLDGWLRGLPDVYASQAWARLYRDFLIDWARLTKALSRFAWRASGDTKGKAAQIARGITGAPTQGAGEAAVMGPGQNLEAIPKSGATIDAGSGRPLAAMTAAGLSLPVTVLLADPGVTGARAVAETLDLPTALAMGMRRMLWQAAYTELVTYACEQAVLAPRGALSGTVRIDAWGQKLITLAGDVTPTVEVDWPPIIDTDPAALVKAIAEADGTGKLPPLVTLRMLLSAMGVKDADEILERHTDENGDWIDPDASAGRAAVDAFRRGEDAAEALR